MSKVRYAFPKYKVYIFGHDVTKDVVSINVTSTDSDEPNVCQIELINELDKYTITTNDMMSLYGSADAILSPGDDGFIEKMQSAGFIKEKADILRKKNSVAKDGATAAQKVAASGTLSSAENYTNYFGKPATRYPLADGCPIFHPMDQVRVFMRDPFDPTRWYHHFCGFISDMVDTTDENNAKTLTIQVEDPTKLFRYTRMFINPGVLDSTKVIRDEDLKVQSFYSNFMRGFNLPEIFFTLIFGPDKVGVTRLQQKVKINGKESSLSTRLRGVGHFSFEGSGIYLYGPDQDVNRSNKRQGYISKSGKVVSGEAAQSDLLTGRKDPVRLDSLSTWQALIDHEVMQADLAYMIPDVISDDVFTNTIQPLTDRLDRDSSDKILIEEVIRFIGENPQWYPVDGGKLLMLIPNSLGPDNRNIVEKDIIQSYPMNSDWHSVGTILFKAVERIQFSMRCTPKGDIVVEFPMFDFMPDDFGTKEISPEELSEDLIRLFATSASKNTLERLVFSLSKYKSRSFGPYADRYKILKQDTVTCDSAIVDEKVYTMGIGSPNIIQNWDGIGTTAIVGKVLAITLTDLVPMYGVRQIPMVTRGNIADEVGLTYYINTTLNRLNADAHTIKVEHMPAIALDVNRPIYIQVKNCISTTRRVNHSLSWPTSMSTSTDLYATRVWDGTTAKGDKTKMVYTPLGGAGSRPLNYSMLHNRFTPPDIANDPQVLNVLDTSTAKSVVKDLNDALDKISPKLDEITGKNKPKTKGR